MTSRRSRHIGYGLAVLTTAITAFVHLGLYPGSAFDGPFTFSPAVMLTSWAGGLGPGLLATAASASAAAAIWTPPSPDLAAFSAGVAVFVVIGVAMSALSERSRRGQLGLAARCEEMEWVNTRLDASVHDLLAVFHTVPVGLARALDAACDNVETNREFIRLLNEPAAGGSDESRQPLKLYRSGIELRREELPLRVAVLENRVVRDFHVDVVLGDGATRSVLLHAAPLADDNGQPRGGVCGGVDVTAYQTRLRALHQNREKLEHALTLEHTARTEAEASSRTKDEFLAMLGHELRNPLGAISSAIQILNMVRADDVAASRARGVITRQTSHLGRLIDDLLDVNRVLTGKIILTRRPVDLGEIAERVTATLSATGRVDHHRLNIATEQVWVNADATRLEQIVTNLVANALKYTHAGGSVGVVVRAEDHGATLAVSDSGAGIPADLLPRVFDLFVQGQQPIDRTQGGLGIGLTLVKQLTELHGGTVMADSAGPGQGSTFTVKLPRIDKPTSDEPSDEMQIATRRVLIIEDAADSREMLRTMLGLAGFEVHTAAEGIGGVDVAERLRPDVVVVDIGLPGIDGYEVARRIKASGHPARLIALTGYGGPEDKVRALRAGFDAHLVKPADFERLIDLIRRAPSPAEERGDVTEHAAPTRQRV